MNPIEALAQDLKLDDSQRQELRPDPKRQANNRGAGQPGTLEQHSKCESDVLDKSVHQNLDAEAALPSLSTQFYLLVPTVAHALGVPRSHSCERMCTRIRTMTLRKFSPRTRITSTLCSRARRVHRG